MYLSRYTGVSTAVRCGVKLSTYSVIFCGVCLVAACSSSPGRMVTGTGTTDADDGATAGAENVDISAIGGSDGIGGATDSVDEPGSADGTADDTNSGADNTNETTGEATTEPPVCTPGEFRCKNTETLMVCGEDGQWRLKHNCPAPYECDAEAGTCTKQSCTPEGTGTAVGDIVKDVTYDLVGGGTYNLHDACAAGEATMIIKVDTWCYYCGEYAPLWQLMADDFSQNGTRFLLLVGRDGQQAPATMQIAEAYKATHGYNNNWMVASDPAHQKIESVIYSPAGGVPNLAVLGPDMRIAYVDPADGGLLSAPFEAASSTTGYYPPQTCEGFCQTGLSTGWCYCNEGCIEYGDCCPDACNACGVNCN